MSRNEKMGLAGAVLLMTAYIAALMFATLSDAHKEYIHECDVSYPVQLDISVEATEHPVDWHQASKAEV